MAFRPLAPPHLAVLECVLRRDTAESVSKGRGTSASATGCTLGSEEIGGGVNLPDKSSEDASGFYSDCPVFHLALPSPIVFQSSLRMPCRLASAIDWHVIERPLRCRQLRKANVWVWPGVLFPACLVFNPKNRHEEERFPLAAIAALRRFPLPLRAGTPRNAPRAEARFFRRCAAIHT
jgi:hypothetical protein